MSERLVLTEKLRIAIKTSPIRGYELARRIGVHRTTLSCWLNRISTPADHRSVVALGKILGVPANACLERAPAPAHPAGHRAGRRARDRGTTEQTVRARDAEATRLT